MGQQTTLKNIVKQIKIEFEEEFDLDNFKKNPIIMGSHDMSQLPIGKVIKFISNNEFLIEIKEEYSSVNAIYDYGYVKNKLLYLVINKK